MNTGYGVMRISQDGFTYKAPTSKDVAILAGVSQTTVSFVINNKSGIAPETRNRVLNAMHTLNYHPNTGARILRTSKTNIIALFAEMHTGKDANETTPYIDTIVRYAEEHGYDVILNTTSHDTTSIQRLANKTLCDAFILMDIATNDPRIPVVCQLTQPTVLIGRPRNSQGLDVVDLDARVAGRLAVDELASTNHHHIAVIGEPTSNPYARDFEEPENMFFIHEFHTAIRQECEKLHIPYAIAQRKSADWKGFVECANTLLKNREDRLGIIVRQPSVAQWLLWYLQERNIQPGKDLSVIAHCSDEYADSFPTPITNISTVPEQVARTAIQLIIEHLENESNNSLHELNHEEQQNTQANHEILVAPSAIHRRTTTVTTWND